MCGEYIMVNLNNDVKKIMNLIEDNGYQVYLVGGFVRDSIIGKENDDFDLCTNMPFDSIKKIIPNFRMMRENSHRNTGIVRINDVDIEISMFKGKDLNEDLFCRDLTINSIAMNSSGEIFDPFNGVDDIKKGIVRITNSTGEAFDKDPLRILRAIRFAGVLGYEIDEVTWNHMLNKKHLLNGVAVERIYSELCKIILCNKPGDLINKYRDVLLEVMPELKDMVGFQQNNPYHMYDVFEHSMVVLNNTSRNLILRFSALFHDCGKPDCMTVDQNGISHFYGHCKFSSDKFKSFAKRMKFDNESIYEIQKLISFHDYVLDTTNKSINRFIRDFGTKNIDLLFELKFADICGQNVDKMERINEIQKLRDVYNDYLNSMPVLSLKDLKINGNVLKEMNFNGKTIGVILNDVLEMVSSGELVNDTDDIKEFVSKKYH